MKEDTLQYIYEAFLKLELRENLFENVQVKHVRIWHYVRFEIFQVLAQFFGKVKNPNDEEKFYPEDHTLRTWIDENVLKNQFRVRHKDVLIINHQRRVKQGSYYKCIYTDEWLKKFDKSYYVFELPYSKKFHFKPIRTKKIRYIDFEQYVNIFHKKYNLDSIYLSEIRKVSDYIIEILELEFNIKLNNKDKKKIQQIILCKISERDIFRDYYSYLLKHISPKLIIYVVGYGLDRMILTELAKELRIPTIEIEHGHIGRSHLAYNFAGNISLKAFPDYLFVAGKHEVDAMRLPIKKENVYIVGSPELDVKTDYYKKALVNKKKKKKIITFISSGEYEIMDAAIELYQKLNKDNFKIYLKLHPSEYTNWRKKYKNFGQSGVYIVDDSAHDIYYYLAVSDFVIGISSTALFEATRFSCNILIYRRGYFYGADSLIRTGNGIPVDSMDEALEYINILEKKRKENVYYYSKNSCQLIYKAIDNIIDRTSKY